MQKINICIIKRGAVIMAQNIRDYEKLAVDIVEAVGGKENIINATRCATRLRLVLKDTTKYNKEIIERNTKRC